MHYCVKHSSLDLLSLLDALGLLGGLRALGLLDARVYWLRWVCFGALGMFGCIG